LQSEFDCTKKALTIKLFNANFKTMTNTLSPKTRKRLVGHDDAPAKQSTKAPAASGVTAEMKERAKEVILANLAKNAQSRAEKKALKALLELMNAADLLQFAFTFFTGEGEEKKQVKGKAEISTPEKSHIDPVKFRKAVGDEIFMKCVSINKTDAEEFAPGNLVTECTITEKGDPTLKVSVEK
jgi:hypothetical protein